jgi:hypothetical protein
MECVWWKETKWLGTNFGHFRNSNDDYNGFYFDTSLVKLLRITGAF